MYFLLCFEFAHLNMQVLIESTRILTIVVRLCQSNVYYCSFGVVFIFAN